MFREIFILVGAEFASFYRSNFKNLLFSKYSYMKLVRASMCKCNIIVKLTINVKTNYRLLPNVDDESDISSLTVTEKQIGVKFEGVRKVYQSEQGDIVAVEDFTLKLCEGEVTSLLGRNGAGKTTIMYVNRVLIKLRFNFPAN